MSEKLPALHIRNNWTNRPVSKMEDEFSESVVELSGYIPPNAQVEGMILSGMMLDRYRDMMYHNYDLGEGDEELDEISDPDDLLDAYYIRKQLNEKYLRAKEAYDRGRAAGEATDEQGSQEASSVKEEVIGAEGGGTSKVNEEGGL